MPTASITINETKPRRRWLQFSLLPLILCAFLTAATGGCSGNAEDETTAAPNQPAPATATPARETDRAATTEPGPQLHRHEHGDTPGEVASSPAPSSSPSSRPTPSRPAHDPTKITFTGVNFEDSRRLSQLITARTLRFRECTLPDLTPLANLTDLVELEFDHCTIGDLAPLAALTNLEKLRIFRTPTHGHSALAGMTKLRSLEIFIDASIADTAFLAEMHQLESLKLSGGHFETLLLPASLLYLQELSVHSSDLQDISALAGAPNLRSVCLNGDFQDLTPLASLTQLVSLDLYSPQLQDLAPLATLAQLQRLDLAFTKVRDLSPLASCGSLQSLYLDGTQIVTLAGLEHLHDLEWLSLNGTRISDLSPLAGLPKLRSLSLVRTSVSDLSPVAEMPALEYLHLGRIHRCMAQYPWSVLPSWASEFTPVSDLTPLAGHPSLTSLVITDAPARDLTPLAECPELSMLSINAEDCDEYINLLPLTQWEIRDPEVSVSAYYHPDIPQEELNRIRESHPELWLIPHEENP